VLTLQRPLFPLEGVAPLLSDTTATVTLFAPADEAWLAVRPGQVDLGDLETLQQILTFLVAQARLGLGGGLVLSL
jgi:hypothetical protein